MLKRKDLIENKIYHHSCDDWGYGYIFKHNSLGWLRDEVKDSVYKSEKYENLRYNLREATKEEVAWFLECEKQNKFISKEQINFNKEIEYEIC